jgi:uncharacterized membrane protein
MSRHARWIVLGLALVGLGFASASSWVHYKLLTDPTYVSPCDVSSQFNCSQAYLSTYGSIGGVPVALGGVVWFALVALIALWARPDASGTPGPAGAYIFALSSAALGVVLYLAYASAFVLKTYCLLCIGTYVSVVGIFVTSGLTSPMPIARLPQRFLRDLRSIVGRPAWLLTALLYLAGGTAAILAFPREGAPPPPAAQEAKLDAEFEKQFAAAWAQQPRTDLGIPADGAKVVIVKFIDWLCPGCKAFDLAYKPIIDKYNISNPRAVKVVIKDWPWNAACNVGGPGTSLPGHEASCAAAAAVRMAGARGKGPEMGEWLFSNQAQLIELGRSGSTAQATTLIKDHLKTLAGVTDFDVQYPAIINAVKRDTSDGVALRVSTTPTYFINGVRVTTERDGQNLQPVVLDLAIRLELGRSPSQ